MSSGYRSVKVPVHNLSPHVLRRTFATLAIRNGAPTRVVQVAGGWANLSEVQRYSQAIEAQDFDGYSATNVIGGPDDR